MEDIVRAADLDEKADNALILGQEPYPEQLIVAQYNQRILATRPNTLSAKGLTFHYKLFNVEKLISQGLLFENHFVRNNREICIAFRIGLVSQFHDLPVLHLRLRFPDLTKNKPWCMDWLVEQGLLVDDCARDPRENLWAHLVVAFLTMITVVNLFKYLKDASNADSAPGSAR